MAVCSTLTFPGKLLPATGGRQVPQHHRQHRLRRGVSDQRGRRHSAGGAAGQVRRKSLVQAKDQHQRLNVKLKEGNAGPFNQHMLTHTVPS